jgi:pimeloyl-ACP methyl ester carboxylesterase
VATYSLVHGAWHGGWAWDFVRAELESRGHVVHAPDLPSEDVDAGLDDYAAVVPPCDVVVGHSLGGYTIARVEAAVHVYVCALIPGATPEFVLGFGDARVRDELDRSYYPDWRDGARELQYPDAHTGLAQLLRRQARIDDPGGSVAGGVYVVCTRDTCVSPRWQREVARRFTRVDLDAGHSPMLTHPGELAELLLRVEL